MSGTHFVRKLEYAFSLSDDDRSAIERIVAADIRSVGIRQDLVSEGSGPQGALLVLKGAACRYKRLPDGRRQIASFMLPGDMCDPRVGFLKSMDHSIAATGPLKIALVSWAGVSELTNGRPKLTRAVLWTKQVDESIAREWAVNLGKRTAFERVAHLLCELHVRLGRVGLAGRDGCRLPMTQGDLADALGLSTVHTNRMLQKLRLQKLVVLRGRNLAIPDFPALAELALFSRNYLDLGYGRAALERGPA